MANLQVTQGTGTFVATVDVGAGIHSPCVNLINGNGAMVAGSVGTPASPVLTVQGVLGGVPQSVTLASGTASLGSVSVTGTSAIFGAVSISGTPSVAVVGTSTISGGVSIIGTPAVTVSGISAMTGTVSVTSMPTVSVTGTTAITGPVTIGSQPAPTGTTAVNGTVSILGTPAVTITGTSAITGAVTISGTPAVTVSGTATVSPITISQMGTASVVPAGPPGTLAVGGGSPGNTPLTTNPINQGSQAISSENATATAGRMVQWVADLVGKQIVMPYANPENFVSGVTPTINGTQAVLVLPAPAGPLRYYITSVSVTNAVNTGTVVGLRDGSSGTTLWSGYCGTQTVGSVQLTFPTPLRQPTAGTALNCFCVTNGASVIVSAQGYKGV